MFQLNKGGLGAPITPVPKFDATPFPELFTPIVNKATPVDFTKSVQNVAPIDMNTIKGVSGKTFVSDKALPLPLPPISSGSTSVARPTLNTAVRAANLPSYVPSDTPAGLISRDDWDNYDDVQFYVGTDGKYHSTEPFFERLFFREGSNDLNARNGEHIGPAQFDVDTWRTAMPGVDASNRTNPDYVGKATANYARINAGLLRKAGVPINAATIYGAHNLGAGTIINMYKNLDAPLLGQDLKYVLGNFRDAKYHAPELYRKYLRDPNSLTGRDYINLINAIFTNKE